MAVSLACSDGEHHLCLRSRCSCGCGHLFRARHRTTTTRRQHADHAVFDTEGRRVCEECRTTVLVKKDPRGRGRYPRRCDDCKNRAKRRLHDRGRLDQNLTVA